MRTKSHPRRRSRTLSALIVLAPGLAAAGDLGERMLASADQALEEAAIAHIPPLEPPTPVKVTWKAKKLGAVDLGAPLITLVAVDFEGDGRSEVVAVTERDVVVLAPQGRRAIAEIARAALPDVPASRQPRDPVAAATWVPEPTTNALVVRASTVGAAAKYVLVDGKLTVSDSKDVYLFCRNVTGELVPGRDYFEREPDDDASPRRYFTAACQDGLVDPIGRWLSVESVLATDGQLTVTASTVCPRAGEGSTDCVAERTFTIGKSGIAFAVNDVDRDGRLEVITSAATAPGDADKVTVLSLPASGTTLPKKPVFEKTFTGGVGGLVAADVDGDGDIEVIAAVRLPGAERIDLWLLD